MYEGMGSFRVRRGLLYMIYYISTKIVAKKGKGSGDTVINAVS